VAACDGLFWILLFFLNIKMHYFLMLLEKNDLLTNSSATIVASTLDRVKT
jgi:hypothetical protein